MSYYAIESILEAHDPEPHRTVAQVGLARLRDVVEVVVDDVVQHAHGGRDGALELAMVDAVRPDVGGQVDRAQVAHRDL